MVVATVLIKLLNGKSNRYIRGEILTIVISDRDIINVIDRSVRVVGEGCLKGIGITIIMSYDPKWLINTTIATTR